MPAIESPASRWILYLLECCDGTFYAGITVDLERRFAEHLAGTGARYTRAHPPMRVIASKRFADRSAASKAEAALKKLPRERKMAFFTDDGEARRPGQRHGEKTRNSSTGEVSGPKVRRKARQC